MKQSRIRMTLAALAACAAAGPLFAQVPTTMTPPAGQAPPPQTMAPMAPPKPLSFQVTGAMTIPVFSYADYLTDIGWQAQGALVMRRGTYNHLRLEGEYNSTGFENTGNLTGSAELYGGGIGGGRVLMRGKVQQEGYLVAGLYNHAFATCALNSCSEASELQFGTKVGFNAVIGRGRVRPVIDFHWLTTWSEPYANLLAIGGGLRF